MCSIFLFHQLSFRCIIADSQLAWQALQQETLSTQQHAYASGTIQSIYGHWKAYLLFCFYFKVPAVPASPDNLACFIQFMARNVKSYQTLCMIVSHVKLLHACYGIEFSPTQYLQVKSTLTGLRRIWCAPPSHKLPMTPEILMKIYNIIDLSNPVLFVCWTVFVVAFFTFLRKSNLVPDNMSQAASSKGHFLRRRDILILRDSALLQISSSKTDNFNEHAWQLPLAAMPSCPLCPVTALRVMIIKFPADLSSPAFLFPNERGVLVPLTYSVLTAVLKNLLKQLQINPDLVSMHSFRRGGFTYAHGLGIPADSLKIHGNWHSNAYQTYLKPHLSRMMDVSKRMLSGIRSNDK